MALAVIERHRFPDGEMRLRLPAELPARVVLWRSLQQPNEKLVELLLAAQTARTLGAQHLTLVAPYLAYMRQDIAFNPGEAVSQRIVGGFLAGLFDAIITVDPHLHRVATLQEAVPVTDAIVLSGAPRAGRPDRHRSAQNPLLIGPGRRIAAVGGAGRRAPRLGPRGVPQGAPWRPRGGHRAARAAGDGPRGGADGRRGQLGPHAGRGGA